MKIEQIIIGRIYTNKGKGKAFRKVVSIGVEHRPQHFSGKQCNTPPANEPGVLFEQKGRIYTLFVSSFAAWAGRDVTEDIKS